MSATTEPTFTVLLDFTAKEAARLQALDPSSSLEEIVRASIVLLGMAAVALTDGMKFGSCDEDGGNRVEPASPALRSASTYDACYA